MGDELDNLEEIAHQRELGGNVGTRSGRRGRKSMKTTGVPFGLRATKSASWRRSLAAYRALDARRKNAK